jgi:hypothetical protein
MIGDLLWLWSLPPFFLLIILQSEGCHICLVGEGLTRIDRDCSGWVGLAFFIQRGKHTWYAEGRRDFAFENGLPGWDALSTRCTHLNACKPQIMSEVVIGVSR